MALTVTDSSEHAASVSHTVRVASPPKIHYKGKTRQNQSISFSVQSGKVLGLDFRIVDGWGRKKTLTVHVSGFPALSIGRNGSFGGTFGSRSQPTVVHGKVKRSGASGTLSDKSVNSHLHKLCSGSTSFTAKKSWGAKRAPPKPAAPV